MSLSSLLGKTLLFGSIAILGLALLLQQGNYSPQYFSLPPPPQLTGPLSPKPLQDPQYILKGKLPSPESVCVDGNSLIAGLGDGRVVKIVDGVIVKSVRHSKYSNCDGSPKTLSYCGRPLGIRKLNEDVFAVADPYLGVYTVNFKTGKTNLLYGPNSVLNGKPSKFLDDIDFVDNDTLIISDASTKYGFEEFYKSILEHNGDGRVIQFKISTHEATVLMDGLHFPNGIQVHFDRQSVLVAETGMARILRYYFTGPKKGRQEVFAENLPGLPDNIRSSAQGTFYVALAAARHSDQDSILDKTADSPWIRKIIGEIQTIEFVRNFLAAMDSAKHGILVELSKNGEIVSSYHDPDGTYFTHTSQVSDDEGYLYVGSIVENYIVRVKKH